MCARRLAPIVVAAAALGLPSTAAAAADASVTRAAAYLERAQNADGGLGAAPGSSSSALFSAWAAIGLAAAGRPADERLTAFLRSHADVTGVGDVERTILALRAQGAAPPPALEERLTAAQAADGGFGRLVNLTSFGVLALRALGRPAGDTAVRRAAAYVLARQHADGSFSLSGRTGAGGIDDTAVALQALRAAGRPRTDRAVRRAASWLLRRQNRDGGFSLVGDLPSNAQSTAFAAQGLVAAGRDPAQRRTGRTRSALGYLRSLQGADGSVRYSRTSRQTPVWVTAQALAALAGKSLPVRRGAGRR